MRDRNGGRTSSTRTAVHFGNATGIFADQLAFRFGTGWLCAFPVTLRLLAHRFALRLGRLAVSDAVRLFADRHTFGAVKSGATFVGTFNFALRLLTFDVTNRVFGFGARSVATRRFTNWVANCGTVRVVAFPRTLRVALK